MGDKHERKKLKYEPNMIVKQTKRESARNSSIRVKKKDVNQTQEAEKNNT